MAENEKALIDAAAALHEIAPDYAAAFLDGVSTAVKAMKAKEQEATNEEAGPEGH